jgi:hypothetical protein
LARFCAPVIRRDDEAALPKQRHAAKHIYGRWKAEHAYTGGYDQVRRDAKRQRARRAPDRNPEAFSQF